MELEDSLPNSQVHATCPNHEPARSSPCPHIPLPEGTPQYYPPIYASVFQMVSFPHVSPPKPCIRISSPPYLHRCVGRTKESVQVRGFLCEHVTWYVCTVRSCSHLAQLPSWRTTPCRLSATAYSIYSHLPSIAEAVPPSATWLRTMPSLQGHTYHGHLVLLRRIRGSCGYEVFTYN